MGIRSTMLVLAVGTALNAPAGAAARVDWDAPVAGSIVPAGSGITVTPRGNLSPVNRQPSLIYIGSLRGRSNRVADFRCGERYGPLLPTGEVVIGSARRIYVAVDFLERGRAGSVCRRLYDTAVAAGARPEPVAGHIEAILTTGDGGRTWSALPPLPADDDVDNVMLDSPNEGALLWGDPKAGWHEWSPEAPGAWSAPAYRGQGFGRRVRDVLVEPTVSDAVRYLGAGRWWAWASGDRGRERFAAGRRRVRTRVLVRVRARWGVPTPSMFVSTCRLDGARAYAMGLESAISDVSGRVIYGVTKSEATGRCRGRRADATVGKRVVVSRNYGRTFRVAGWRLAKLAAVAAVDRGRPVVITDSRCRAREQRYFRLVGKRWRDLGCRYDINVVEEN